MSRCLVEGPISRTSDFSLASLEVGIHFGFDLSFSNRPKAEKHL